MMNTDIVDLLRIVCASVPPAEQWSVEFFGQCKGDPAEVSK
jgi:hypothetical protein